MGYYLDKDHRKAILISDYMVNGDLKEYIEDRRPDWGVRLELVSPAPYSSFSILNSKYRLEILQMGFNTFTHELHLFVMAI